jgi:hypothetical protein
MSLKRSLSMVDPLPALLTLAFAIPFLWIGVSEAREAQVKVASYAVAEGSVTDNNYLSTQDLEDSSRETWAYYPVVTFTTGDGDLVTFTDGVGTFPPEYEEGERVEVLYDPQNPHDATIKSWKRIWMGPLWVMAIGLLPVLVWTGWLLWFHLMQRHSWQPDKAKR